MIGRRLRLENGLDRVSGTLLKRERDEPEGEAAALRDTLE